MLGFVVRLTALLLGIGSALAIVGTFDGVLGWDLFGPELESVLYGLLVSCLVVAAAGIALSFVLGVLEITELLRASQARQAPPPPRPASRYAAFATAGALGLMAVVVTLELADRRVQTQRNLVFQRLATEEVTPLTTRLMAQLPTGESRPAPNAEIDQILASINGLAWVERATVFLPDGVDPERIWMYDAHRDRSERTRFDRRFPSKDHEHAIQRAFAGDVEALRRFNESSAFELVVPLPAEGSLAAVVFVEADRRQSLRE